MMNLPHDGALKIAVKLIILSTKSRSSRSAMFNVERWKPGTELKRDFYG